jgi:hypothetical protein
MRTVLRPPPDSGQHVRDYLIFVGVGHNSASFPPLSVISRIRQSAERAENLFVLGV